MNHSSYNALTKIWSGSEKPPIFNTNVSLGYLILNVLKHNPGRITQVFADTDSEMTCREMRVRTIKIATHLMNVGMKQCDVVGVIAANSENVAPVVFACFTLGLPINTLAPMLVEADIIHMYSKTKPKIIICDSTVIAVVQNAVHMMEIKPEIYTFLNRVDGCKFVNDLLEVDCNVDDSEFPKLIDVSNSTAVILCSSGTTGRPKGVCKSHSQIIAQIKPTWEPPNSQEIFMNFSTLFWSSGLSFLIIGTLYGGKRIITTKPFSVNLLAELFSRYKVTTTVLVPSILKHLLVNESLKPIESVEVVMVGGTAIPKGLCQSAKRLFPNGDVFAIYGMTEVDLLVNSHFFKRQGSVGKVLAGNHIKIVDEAGNNLGPNQHGEVCFKTPVIFSGYFDEPERTAEAINDGWVYSGDIGHFDDDGFLFIIDRIKDTIRFNGFQLYPSELEDIINEIDGVISSCVVGVFEESSGNDLVFAFVVKNPNNDKLTEDFILDYVNSRVIDVRKLRGGVHFLDKLPMTVSGKIQKQAVKKIAQQYLQTNSVQ